MFCSQTAQVTGRSLVVTALDTGGVAVAVTVAFRRRDCFTEDDVEVEVVGEFGEEPSAVPLEVLLETLLAIGLTWTVLPEVGLCCFAFFPAAGILQSHTNSNSAPLCISSACLFHTVSEFFL